MVGWNVVVAICVVVFVLGHLAGWLQRERTPHDK